MKTPNIDLGKYDLNKVLRNPALIHKIQDNLEQINGDDMLSYAIKNGAKKDIKSRIKMVLSQYNDNPEIIKQIIGKETLKLIVEYEGLETIDDLPNNLYSQTKTE